MDLGLRRRISKHGRSERRRWRNGEGKAMILVCRNVKGKPLFIGRSRARRRTVHLDSRARYATSCHLPSKIVCTLSLAVPSKDTSYDGSLGRWAKNRHR